MTSPIHTRILAGLVGLVLAGGATTACAGDPAPEPTKTPAFASEEEAFAAAEATYRLYNEAVNSGDLADPTTFETVYELSTGDVQSSVKETLSEFHAEGLTDSVKTNSLSFTPEKATLDPVRIDALVCTDVSKVEAHDSSGKSVIASSRPDTQALQVGFERGDSPTGLILASSVAAEGSSCDR